MKRRARLQSAKSFLLKFAGDNVVRAYSRWFGVDYVCALVELQMLDVPIDPELAEKMRTAQRERERQGRLRNEKRRQARAARMTVVPPEFGSEWEALPDLEDEPMSDIPF